MLFINKYYSNEEAMKRELTKEARKEDLFAKVTILKHIKKVTIETSKETIVLSYKPCIIGKLETFDIQ